MIDGAGAPARRADVRVAGDSIAEIGPALRPRPGEQVPDVSGLVVPPGFIDLHPHADRGILANGRKADILVFDPALIQDRGTTADPSQPPTGERYTIVNGEIALQHGMPTGARSGRWPPSRSVRCTRGDALTVRPSAARETS